MTQPHDPNGYTEADVRALADILADAAMRGIRYGTATLARTILDAGWRRPPTALVDEHADEEQRYPQGRYGYAPVPFVFFDLGAAPFAWPRLVFAEPVWAAPQDGGQ